MSTDCDRVDGLPTERERVADRVIEALLAVDAARDHGDEGNVAWAEIEARSALDAYRALAPTKEAQGG